MSSNIYSVLRLATASLFTPGAGWCGPGWKIAEIVGSWAAANTIIITMARLIWAAYRTQRTTICTREAANHPLDTRHRHSSFHHNNNNNTAVVTPDTCHTGHQQPQCSHHIINHCRPVLPVPMSPRPAPVVLLLVVVVVTRPGMLSCPAQPSTT